MKSKSKSERGMIPFVRGIFDEGNDFASGIMSHSAGARALSRRLECTACVVPLLAT